jgi:hypothetical protein
LIEGEGARRIKVSIIYVRTAVDAGRKPEPRIDPKIQEIVDRVERGVDKLSRNNVGLKKILVAIIGEGLALKINNFYNKMKNNKRHPVTAFFKFRGRGSGRDGGGRS